MENKQHYQLPSDMNDNVITFRDIAIYLFLRKYGNGPSPDEQSTFVSVQRISEETGLNKRTIMAGIARLVTDGYLTIKKHKGRSNEYVFNKYKNFEPFGPDFLANKDLTIEEKGYLAALQKYMCTEDGATGKVSLRNSEIADRLHCSKRTVIQYNNSLYDKGYLVYADLKTKDIIEEGACHKKLKVFDLKAYGQAVVFALRNHEDRLQEQEDITTDHEARIKQLETLVKNYSIAFQEAKAREAKKDKTIKYLQDTLNFKIMMDKKALKL